MGLNYLSRRVGELVDLCEFILPPTRLFLGTGTGQWEGVWLITQGEGDIERIEALMPWPKASPLNGKLRASHPLEYTGAQMLAALAIPENERRLIFKRHGGSYCPNELAHLSASVLGSELLDVLWPMWPCGGGHFPYGEYLNVSTWSPRGFIDWVLERWTYGLFHARLEKDTLWFDVKRAYEAWKQNIPDPPGSRELIIALRETGEFVGGRDSRTLRMDGKVVRMSGIKGPAGEGASPAGRETGFPREL
jgi:hypothetical protein